MRLRRESCSKGWMGLHSLETFVEGREMVADWVPRGEGYGMYGGWMAKCLNERRHRSDYRNCHWTRSLARGTLRGFWCRGSSSLSGRCTRAFVFCFWINSAIMSLRLVGFKIRFERFGVVLEAGVFHRFENVPAVKDHATGLCCVFCGCRGGVCQFGRMHKRGVDGGI